MGVHLCVVFGSFGGCHGNGSQELVENRGKLYIFRNLCDTYV